MLKRFLLAFVMAVVMTLPVAGTASAAPSNGAAAPSSCAQALDVIGGWGGGTNTSTFFGITFTAACSGKILVEWQMTNLAGQTIWQHSDHHYPVFAGTNNDPQATWTFGSTPPGAYDVYVTLASQSHRVTYFQSLWTTVDVPSASSVGAASAKAQLASCTQAVQVTGYGEGYSPTHAGFGISFNVTCPGTMLVKWEALNTSTGHVVWKSADHHFIVSPDTTNNATATWSFGKTTQGMYDIYVTLASQNGQAVYYQTWFGGIGF